MNEKGFFTVTALFLLMIISLSAILIQSSETNNTDTSTNFMIELELQIAADSALIKATEKISPEKIYYNPTLILSDSKFSEQMKKNISVQVYVKSSLVHTELGTYFDKDIPGDKPGKIFMSVASCDSDFILGKVYRRTFAYILDEDENKTVHYMNSLSGSD